MPKQVKPRKMGAATLGPRPKITKLPKKTATNTSNTQKDVNVRTEPNNAKETTEKPKQARKVVRYASSWGRFKRGKYGLPTFGHLVGPYYMYKNIKAHRITQYAFRGKPPTEPPGKKYSVDHIDGDPKNNHIDNLRYATPSQQVKNSHETNKARKSSGAKKAVEVWKEDNNGHAIGEKTIYTSLGAAAIDLGVSIQAVSAAIKRRGKAAKHRVDFSLASLPGEEWKPASCDGVPIPGAEASSKGRVKFENRITYGSKREDGYMIICLNDADYLVHRIICSTFSGEGADFTKTVDHCDSVRGNNCADNLTWATRKDQIVRRDARPCNADVGKRIGEKKSIKVKARKIGGDGVWEVFRTATKAAEILEEREGTKFSGSGIAKRCARPNNKCTKGYEFDYVNPERFSNLPGEIWTELYVEDFKIIRSLVKKTEKQRIWCKPVVIRSESSPEKIVMVCEEARAAATYLTERHPSDRYFSDDPISRACRSGEAYRGYIFAYQEKKDISHDVGEDASECDEEGEEVDEYDTESDKEVDEYDTESDKEVDEYDTESDREVDEYQSAEEIDREIEEIYANAERPMGEPKKKRRK